MGERTSRDLIRTGEKSAFVTALFRDLPELPWFEENGVGPDENGELLPGKDRLTPFGRKLRSTSLDELPEIFNILKGDMSIVGPRPLGMKYIPYYTDEERVRHDVRPGLTGLAQVRGRNDLSWEEKFAYDIEYVNDITFLNDVKILIETVQKVYKREGIGQGEETPVSLHVERAGKELR